MPDDQDRRGDEPEIKVTVRDRRRVSAEGSLREVPAEPEAPVAETPAAEAPAPEAPRAPAPPPPPASRPRPRAAAGGGGLGGADEARVRRDAGSHLREVSEDDGDDDEAADAPEGGMPPVRNVYEYIATVTAEMTVWCLSALGLVPNPITRIVATDLEQAKFAQLVTQRMLDTLDGALKPEELAGLYQNFVLQYAQVAMQLLQQPPQVRLAEIQKIRFCIDASEGFLKGLLDVDIAPEITRVAELQRLVGELKLRFLQASGGGGIVG